MADDHHLKIIRPYCG